MQLSFRWYGLQDPVSLQDIRQIPGVVGVVSALHEIAPGEVWTKDAIGKLVDQIKTNGLMLTAVESLPVHEDIKLGNPTRDQYIANYITSLKNLAAAKTALEQGTPIIIIQETPIKGKDFADGKADELFKELVSKGAKTVASSRDVLPILRSLEQK